MPFDAAAAQELRDLLDRGQQAAQMMLPRELLPRVRDLVTELERMREAQRLLEKVDDAFQDRREQMTGEPGEVLREIHVWLVAR